MLWRAIVNAKFLVIPRMLSHAMFVPESSTVTLWNDLEHSTK